MKLRTHVKAGVVVFESAYPNMSLCTNQAIARGLFYGERCNCTQAPAPLPKLTCTK